MQSTSASTPQSLNKPNQSVQFSNNTQINSSNSIFEDNKFQNTKLQTSSHNGYNRARYQQSREINQKQFTSLIENQNNSSIATSQIRMNFLNDSPIKYSSPNSISNSSLSSKIIPSNSNLIQNLSCTLTNDYLSKMNSTAVQGFNGYHSKSNLNEVEGARLMLHLQQYIENSICEIQMRFYLYC
ncbi:hypothetical protein ABPG72_008298 [Tetrahymena utriculariae]